MSLPSVRTTWVVMFGRIRILDREDQAEAFFARFMTKYAAADSWGRETGSFSRIPATIVYAITPELVTGKHGVLPPLDERWPARNNTLSPEWKSRRGSETRTLHSKTKVSRQLCFRLTQRAGSKHVLRNSRCYICFSEPPLRRPFGDAASGWSPAPCERAFRGLPRGKRRASVGRRGQVTLFKDLAGHRSAE